ncbi:MAG: ComEA family DNA-binding protein [Clostridia bacterium]|nr:ComEA family DNA-binding protein [Clostridia bacterium]
MFFIGIYFFIQFFSAPGFNEVAPYEITEVPRVTKPVTPDYTTSQTYVETSSTITVPEKETQFKVNINTATKEELMQLKYIGEARADAIIEFREVNGEFKEIYELANVDGITDKMIAVNLGRIII